jgi:hypothetical protein
MADERKLRDAFGRWARSKRGGVELDVPDCAQSPFSGQIRAEFKRAQAGESHVDQLKRELAETRAETAALKRELD